MTSSVILTPKRHLVAWKHIVWDLGACPRKKTGQDSQKSHKGIISYPRVLGRSPHRTDLHRNLYNRCRPNIITCAKFWTEIFCGYGFTGGWIYDFPIDSCMRFTTLLWYEKLLLWKIHYFSYNNPSNNLVQVKFCPLRWYQYLAWPMEYLLNS